MDALAANLRRARDIADKYAMPDTRPFQRTLLSHVAEGLNAAHKAAKVDDDGHTLD